MGIKGWQGLILRKIGMQRIGLSTTYSKQSRDLDGLGRGKCCQLPTELGIQSLRDMTWRFLVAKLG